MSHPPVPSWAAHAVARPPVGPTAARPRPSRLLGIALLSVALLLGHGIGHAQSFDANRYYQQCQREAGVHHGGVDLQGVQAGLAGGLQIATGLEPQALLVVAGGVEALCVADAVPEQERQRQRH